MQEPYEFILYALFEDKDRLLMSAANEKAVLKYYEEMSLDQKKRISFKKKVFSFETNSDWQEWDVGGKENKKIANGKGPGGK